MMLFLFIIKEFTWDNYMKEWITGGRHKVMINLTSQFKRIFASQRPYIQIHSSAQTKVNSN